MNAPLAGRTVLLGVTGGIAAYKACEVTSRLVKLGADVRVILTDHAARFVPPLTFQALSKHPVAMDMFEEPAQWEIQHISWAKAASLFIVAPATANVMGKYAAGIADDMLTTTLLATRAPVLLAPAMNVAMWRHPATQQNLQTLTARGVRTVGPGSGYLACGDINEGRMAEPVDIVEAALAILQTPQDLAGKAVLVTAGPTREALDPVRYLTNHSSGKMGYALAEAALARGARVTLVTGPVALTPPAGAEVVRVTSTADLYQAVTSRAAEQDIIIQAAAPCDFTAEAAPQKIKKADGAPLTLSLRQTPDIARVVGESKRPGQFIIAFAAETENLLANARGKLLRKRADLVVANDVSREGAGFSGDTNIITLVTADAHREYPQMSKRQLADVILSAAITGVI
ncbi:MAG: bifunctional phosphopantothenoylcysteine decarboxylase/phosphopantothenate--cysteine ligase CoaBC [Oscillospiraceae bacterium]|jgi:phosphopantothenoylcysteine decarboxylase/phosphopantothenate--cysteine ligase|nr:bifunctional phosphopantothenoylcysteine decarboxylase/phosphopantothenate--cysteine ligase CoaBC [Oscillospiraceae bacterium]